MSLFALIAEFINKILNFSLLPSLPSLPSLPGSEVRENVVNDDKRDTEEFRDIGEQTKGRSLLTRPENVNPNARFTSTGSSAWVNQWPGVVINGVNMAGRHGGTDYLGPIGTKVYAPFDMNIIAIGHYSDAGRYGDYVIGTVGELEFYSGHLKDIKVSNGPIKAGTELGEMNHLNHTHIQIKRNGQIIDPESILT
jgi:murein DD-endopeptidase MepM/ murein hydrolase activator NlpD